MRLNIILQRIIVMWEIRIQTKNQYNNSPDDTMFATFSTENAFRQNVPMNHSLVRNKNEKGE
mgnify:CR=1 FL=1